MEKEFTTLAVPTAPTTEEELAVLPEETESGDEEHEDEQMEEAEAEG